MEKKVILVDENDMEKKVILVDENDKDLGSATKHDVHKNARLHRAFSILIFNSKGELLIQQRAFSKYHCGGLWSNTCCSHPGPGQTLEEAMHLRLKEEMGFDTELTKIDSFIYKAHFDNGLTEYEYDHIYAGRWDGIPKINPEEAADYRWVLVADLAKQIIKEPTVFTVWFRIAIKRLIGIGFINPGILNPQPVVEAAFSLEQI